MFYEKYHWPRDPNHSCSLPLANFTHNHAFLSLLQVTVPLRFEGTCLGFAQTPVLPSFIFVSWVSQCKKRAAPLQRARITSQLSLFCGCTKPVVRRPLLTILDLWACLLFYYCPPLKVIILPCFTLHPFLYLTLQVWGQKQTRCWCGSGAVVIQGKSLRERTRCVHITNGPLRPWRPPASFSYSAAPLF